VELAAHSDWKARLVSAVATSSTELKVSEVRAPDRCAFGAWLHGTIEPADRSAKQYERVASLHARFHQLAADVLDLAQTSQRDAALAAFEPGSEYAGVSADLADHIVEWRRSRNPKT